MSSPACLTQDVSVCLRCQNRIASRRQFRRRPMSCAVSLRSMTSTRYLSQEQTQHEYPASNSDTPTIFSQFVYQNRLPYSKHTGLLSQSSEKIEVLGRSAEILLLPNTGRLKTVKKSNTSQSEESSEVGVKLGYSEMLEAMNEERGVVSPARVAKNIESIKTSWLSRLHNRAGVPSLSEYERIARDLSEGFTFLQLQRYLKLPSIGIPASAMELAEPYSTDLYTRSSWRPEFTPFPGNVSSQLLSLRGIINDGDDTKPRGPNINIVKRNESGRSAKSFIIDKILRDRWKFKTNKEKEIKGELDIWIQQDSLNLILNHRNKIFNQLAVNFEVKLDISRSLGVLRITGDIDTCSDVFRSLVHTLEQVRSVEITVSSEHLLSERIPNQVERTSNELLLRQIEDNTSTVLIPSHRSPEPADIAKTVGLFPLADTTCHLSLLRVYYLGPQKHDLKNVQRLLSQNFEASPLMRSFVIWERDRHFIRAKASPVEVGKGLPLVERGTQWSRWRTEIKKEVDDSYDDVKPKQHGNVLRTIASKTDPKQQHTVSTSAYQLLLDDIKFLDTLIVSPSYSNDFWEKHLIRETAAVFGQVIYPSASIHKFRQEVTKGRSRFGGPALQNQLQSRRSFYSNFPGMRWFLFSRPKPWFKGICLEESSREDLRIRLTPSQPKRMHEGKQTIFPDLELRLTIDVEKNEINLDSVRLIVDQGHVDLLLPEEVTDVRFLTECYIPGGCQIDPRISDFVNSSNLSVLKQDRLDTPATLRVSIPKYATRSRSTSASKIYNFNVDTGPDVPVEYTFANWTHRSYCTNIADKSELEFAIIKSGQTGGRRNEVRVVWQGLSRSIANFTHYFLHVRDLVDQFGKSINVDKRVLQIRHVEHKT